MVDSLKYLDKFMMNLNKPVFTYQTFTILGLVFEIFGALFLSMEAIGVNRFRRVYSFIYKYSKWVKKSTFRMILPMFPFVLFFILGFILNGAFLALSILILFFISFSGLLVDHPDYYEKLIIRKTEQEAIGPFGFLIMLMGFVFQLISTIWQLFEKA